MMNFSQALDELKQGNYVQREVWKEKEMYVGLHTMYSKTYQCHYHHFRIINPPKGIYGLGVWTASTEDLLAEDWSVCNGGHLCDTN